MPDRFSRALQGLHDMGADLDATAMAEALWLAATLRGPAGPQQPGTGKSRPLQPWAEGAQSHRAQGNLATMDAPRPGVAVHEQLPGSLGSVPGEPIAVTRGRALPDSLDLLRALRAYKQPWVAGLHTELDVERTIDGYARSGELIPAFRAAPERWFDLLLIVDRSLSMLVWKETIAELERVLDHLGAFRLLRTWGLTFDEAQPLLHDHQGAVAGPDHVLSPQGRRLVLLVSDCSAPGWYRQEIWKQLRAWAQSTSVALLDPLPPKLWRRSALDLPGVCATQAVPGNGSTTMHFGMPPLLEDPADGPSAWLPVPVLSLSPHSLNRWARTQMRGDPSGCDAVLIPPTGRVQRGSTNPGRTAQIDPVQAFVRTASPYAVKLAVLCAMVGRIGLPVVQLIRHELVPQATVADLAELVTSTIVSLHPQENGTFVLAFRDGAEEELKRLLPQHEAWQLCGMLEKHVSTRAHGTAVVPAVLHHPAALQHLPAEARPFGHAALSALQALGISNGTQQQDGTASFLADATARIADGLDVDDILRALSSSAVPFVADDLIVYLSDPMPVGDERPTKPTALRRWDDHHSDGIEGNLAPSSPPRSALRMVNEVCEVGPHSALADLLQTGRPALIDEPNARAALAELLGKGEAGALLRENHAIVVPLRSQRRMIGVALFLRRPDRAPFDPDDLLLAGQLATHGALALGNMTQHNHDAGIAARFRHSMLPQTLPQLAGVQLASRYLPAPSSSRVGGDWYDAIPLPHNRVALVVGDVMGHSMTSAAIMGQLRPATQSLAGLDLPPQEVLHHLDEQAQRMGTDRMATCLYAVYDPVSHRITIANAGHPPPVLLHLDGRAEVLRVPAGAPIGVGGVDFEAVELDAPAGATLLLYTDGLIESRLRDVWTGIEQLREKLAAVAQLTAPEHPPPLEALCDEVLDMLGPGDREDDIVLLAARLEGIAPSKERTRPRYQLAVEALVVTTARAEQLRGILPEHQRICHLCRDIRSVAEVSALLSIPLGVARILVADLAEAGLVTIHQPGGREADGPHADTSLIERVLNGLRKL